jgi:hypothetical protein
VNTVKTEEVSRASHNRVLKCDHSTISWVGYPGENGLVSREGKPNTSFEKIDAKLVQVMRGPMLFHGMRRHLDLMDLRHIVDWMREQYWITECSAESSMTGVEAVRIDCLDEQEITRRSRYEIWRMNDDLINTEPILFIKIAHKIELPLTVHGLPPALTWRGRHISVAAFIRYEHNFSFMMLNPAQWLRLANSIVVTRRDREHVHIAHMEALVSYCTALGWTFDQFRQGALEATEDEDLKSVVGPNHQASARQILEWASKVGFIRHCTLFIVVRERSERETCGIRVWKSEAIYARASQGTG